MRPTAGDYEGMLLIRPNPKERKEKLTGLSGGREARPLYAETSEVLFVSHDKAELNQTRSRTNMQSQREPRRPWAEEGEDNKATSRLVHEVNFT
eukprot:752595-Hanusia_phi.AAC.4